MLPKISFLTPLHLDFAFNQSLIHNIVTLFLTLYFYSLSASANHLQQVGSQL